MTHSNSDNLGFDGLDDLLAEAASSKTPAPDEAFMARMVQDALAQQPLPSVARTPWWQQLTSAVGGWQGMGGLVAATCAGLWIGVSPPDMMPASFDNLLNTDAVYSDVDSEEFAELTGFGWDIEEG